MKNVTISMDDDLYRLTRIGAAKAGKSMSRYMAEAAQAKLDMDLDASDSLRNREFEAIEHFLAGPSLNVSERGRMPSAEERNARGWQRDIR